MSFGILRSFLSLGASNSKSITLRRFLNTAASDSNPLHNGNGKLKGGSQFRDAVSVQDPSEIELNHRRPKILMGIAVAGLFLGHELISRADAENLRSELLENLPHVEGYETLKEDWLKRLETVKIREEEADREYKLLLRELEELKRDNDPNI